MGFLTKLLPVAGALLGGPAGLALGAAVGGALGSGSQKKQANRSIADYGAAETGSLNALTGARDASLGYLQPYREGGAAQFGAAADMLQPGYDYTSEDPSFGFGLETGVNALGRSASARGGIHSGGALKDLMRFGTDYGTTKLGESFARRNQLAQMGLTAANSSALAQDRYAGGVSNALFAAARGRDPARAAVGQANSDQFGAAADIGGAVAGLLGGKGGGQGGFDLSQVGATVFGGF